MTITSIVHTYTHKQVEIDNGTYYGKLYISFPPSGKITDFSISNQRFFKIIVNEDGITYISVELTPDGIKIQHYVNEPEPFPRMFDIFYKGTEAGALITKEDFESHFNAAQKKLKKFIEL